MAHYHIIVGIDWGRVDSQTDVGFFRKEYLGMFAEPSPEERRAIEVWCWYYVSTELYDRRVCSGPMGHDGIMPANNSERWVCERHALARYADVQHALADVDRAVAYRAKEVACALRFEVQEAVARSARLILSPWPVTRSADLQTPAPPSESE